MYGTTAGVFNSRNYPGIAHHIDSPIDSRLNGLDRANVLIRVSRIREARDLVIATKSSRSMTLSFSSRIRSKVELDGDTVAVFFRLHF